MDEEDGIDDDYDEELSNKEIEMIEDANDGEQDEDDDSNEVKLAGYCTAYDPIIQKKVKHKVLYDADTKVWIAISLVTGNRFVYHSYAELARKMENIDELLEEYAKEQIKTQEEIDEGDTIQALQRQNQAKKWLKNRIEEEEEGLKGTKYEEELTDDDKLSYLISQKEEELRKKNEEWDTEENIEEYDEDAELSKEESNEDEDVEDTEEE